MGVSSTRPGVFADVTFAICCIPRARRKCSMSRATRALRLNCELRHSGHMSNRATLRCTDYSSSPVSMSDFDVPGCSSESHGRAVGSKPKHRQRSERDPTGYRTKADGAKRPALCCRVRVRCTALGYELRRCSSVSRVHTSEPYPMGAGFSSFSLPDGSSSASRPKTTSSLCAADCAKEAVLSLFVGSISSDVLPMEVGSAASPSARL